MLKCVVMHSIILLAAIFIDSFAHYQDIIINNMLLTHGSYECASRYTIIKQFLAKNFNNRPFTVLDLGASEGYFSFKIAHDFKAFCVMIEGNYSIACSEETADRLEELCIENTELKNIILLKTCIKPHELRVLNRHEHFDVVLALNFVHHFGSHWQEVAEAIISLGNYIILQTPAHTEIEDFISARNGILLSREIKTKDPIYLLNGSQSQARYGISIGTYSKLNGVYPYHNINNLIEQKCGRNIDLEHIIISGQDIRSVY